MKHLYGISILLLFFTAVCTAQETGSIPHNNKQNETEQSAVLPAIDEFETELLDEEIFPDMDNPEAAFPDLPAYHSAFKIMPHYYGLPVSVQLGWFYRKEDISVFPHTGIAFDADGKPSLNTSAGFTLQKKFFTWYAAAMYDIIPFTMNKKLQGQIVYGVTSASFTLPGIKVTFPMRAGRRQRIALGTENAQMPQTQAINQPSPAFYTTSRTVTEFSAGVHFDFFIADAGFFRSTGKAALTYYVVPADNAHFYTLTAAIPASFHLYHVDIACMYSLFHTGMIQSKYTAPKVQYEIGRTQETLTGRHSFKPLPLCRTMHLFSSELRWYVLRVKTQTNGFFLSLFADMGMGVTSRNNMQFFYEWGGGIGYTLFDSVPFTFQAGINQRLQPVFYLAVVSRLSHTP